MGWGPRDKGIGRRFASEIGDGDVILIARRDQGRPDYFGFGVVKGPVVHRRQRSADPGRFGSIRRLTRLREDTPPPRLPLFPAVNHRMALAQLHPSKKPDHARIVRWIEERLGGASTVANRQAPGSQPVDVRTLAAAQRGDPEYQTRSRAAVRMAQRIEARLVHSYGRWLAKQGRELKRQAYGRLMCDAFEDANNCLIEAKSSSKREHIRMGVGQLMDYAYQGQRLRRNPRLALLLPHRPTGDGLEWLKALGIAVIWRKGQVFVDDAGGTIAGSLTRISSRGRRRPRG